MSPPGEAVIEATSNLFGVIWQSIFQTFSCLTIRKNGNLPFRLRSWAALTAFGSEKHRRGAPPEKIVFFAIIFKKFLGTLACIRIFPSMSRKQTAHPPSQEIGFGEIDFTFSSSAETARITSESVRAGTITPGFGDILFIVSELSLVEFDDRSESRNCRWRRGYFCFSEFNVHSSEFLARVRVAADAIILPLFLQSAALIQKKLDSGLDMEILRVHSLDRRRISVIYHL